MVDSIVRIDQLTQTARADQQGAIAISDLGNMFAWIKFYNAARGAGLKPICAVDAWLTNDDDRERPTRLLLIAKNHSGYGRLCQLLSRAWLENQFRGRGEFRREWFNQEKDLIALSGAQWGDVGIALLAGQATKAQELALDWSTRFCGQYFLELQRYGHADSSLQTKAAALLGARLSIPCVATHP
jgi:DNA polymerase III subunit alpha